MAKKHTIRNEALKATFLSTSKHTPFPSLAKYFQDTSSSTQTCPLLLPRYLGGLVVDSTLFKKLICGLISELVIDSNGDQATGVV